MKNGSGYLGIRSATDVGLVPVIRYSRGGAQSQAVGLKRTDCRHTARAGSLDERVDLLQAVLLCPTSGRFRSHLRGVRGPLARTLEADLTRRGPGDDSTGRVGDRH